MLLLGWNAVSAITMMALTIAEVMFAYFLLLSFGRKKKKWFGSLEGLLIFLASSPLFAAAMFAFPASLIIGPVQPELSAAGLWLAWWIALGLGNLMVTPIALLMLNSELAREWSSKSTRERHQNLMAIFGVGAVTVVTFTQSVWPILFLPVFPIIVAAFAGERIGVLVSVMLVFVIALWATESGSGPIVAMLHDSPERLLVLQLYIATLFISALAAAVELRKRLDAAERLRAALLKLSVSRRERSILSSSDPLTGVGNRRLFVERLEKILQHGVGVVLIIIDLRSFRSINDRWGYLVGDQILKVAANRLREMLGEKGLLARMGGDEFVILATGRHAVDPEKLGRTVVDRLNVPVEIGRREFRMEFVCGLVSAHPGEPIDASRLISRAEVALSHAKAKEKCSMIVFKEDMEAEEERKILIGELLSTSEGRKDVRLKYQPVFDLQTGRVISFEALARWKSADYGNIPPSEFIPLAERTGVIQALTWQLFEVAAADAINWRPDVCLSFNISAAHIGDPDFANEIISLLNIIGLNPSRLKIEITETSLLNDSDNAVSNCEILQNYGVRIVLDDFGAGFASLSYLRTMRFDEIKLDSSLTIAAHRRDGQLLSKGVIELCKALAVPCTAEHLETQSDVDRFKSLGCNYGQGFYLHRPVSAFEIPLIAPIMKLQPR